MDFLLFIACGLLLYLVVRLVACWLVRRERAACQARAARAAQRERETLQSYRANTIPGRKGRVGDTATTTSTPWDAFVPAQADTPLPAVPHVYSSPSLHGHGGEFAGGGASGSWAPSSCGGSDYSSGSSDSSSSSCSSSGSD